MALTTPEGGESAEEDPRSLFGSASQEEMAAFWSANRTCVHNQALASACVRDAHRLWVAGRRFSSEFRERWSFDPDASEPDDGGSYQWERVSWGATPAYAAGQLSNLQLN